MTKINNIIIQIQSTSSKFSNNDKYFYLIYRISKTNNRQAFKVVNNVSNI
jgi:hypothetical protein